MSDVFRKKGKFEKSMVLITEHGAQVIGRGMVPTERRSMVLSKTEFLRHGAF